MFGRAVVLVVLQLLVALQSASADDAFTKCSKHVVAGVPKYIEGGEDVTPLCRIGYALSHNNQKKVPDSVSWQLTKEHAMGCLRRKNTFASDKELAKGSRAELSDYKGKGYDRGHMAPNADFLWSAKAQRQSFLLSNMAPQLHQFNDGIFELCPSSCQGFFA